MRSESTIRSTGRRLVAAIEIVSPSNKDRPDSRETFVAKVAGLLQKDVCVSIIDLVTIRQFNLYADLLELLGQDDPQLTPTPPNIYAVTLLPQAAEQAVPVGCLVLPNEHWRVVADAAHLADTRSARALAAASELRRNLPIAAHCVSIGDRFIYAT